MSNQSVSPCPELAYTELVEVSKESVPKKSVSSRPELVEGISVYVNPRLKNMFLNIVHKYIRIYLYTFSRHPGLAGLNQLSTNDQRLATILVLTFL